MASIHSFFSSGDLAISTNHLFLAMLWTFQLLVTVIPLVWKSAGGEGERRHHLTVCRVVSGPHTCTILYILHIQVLHWDTATE